MEGFVADCGRDFAPGQTTGARSGIPKPWVSYGLLCVLLSPGPARDAEACQVETACLVVYWSINSAGTIFCQVGPFVK